MNYMKKQRAMRSIVRLIDYIVSLFMLLSIVAVVIFVGFEVFSLFQDSLTADPKRVLKSVALIVILVKAYRLLLYYMQSHHVSIRYIIEISIIAPSVELIFAPEGRSLELNILYAVFALVNLIVYLLYGKKIDAMDSDKAEIE